MPIFRDFYWKLFLIQNTQFQVISWFTKAQINSRRFQAAWVSYMRPTILSKIVSTRPFHATSFEWFTIQMLILWWKIPYENSTNGKTLIRLIHLFFLFNLNRLIQVPLKKNLGKILNKLLFVNIFFIQRHHKRHYEYKPFACDQCTFQTNCRANLKVENFGFYQIKSNIWWWCLIFYLLLLGSWKTHSFDGPGVIQLIQLQANKKFSLKGHEIFSRWRRGDWNIKGSLV